jgi:hypothetical protein
MTGANFPIIALMRRFNVSFSIIQTIKRKFLKKLLIFEPIGFGGNRSGI